MATKLENDKIKAIDLFIEIVKNKNTEIEIDFVENPNFTLGHTNELFFKFRFSSSKKEDLDYYLTLNNLDIWYFFIINEIKIYLRLFNNGNIVNIQYMCFDKNFLNKFEISYEQIEKSIEKLFEKINQSIIENNEKIKKIELENKNLKNKIVEIENFTGVSPVFM